MSIWGTTAEIRVKKYKNSVTDPRLASDVDSIDVAVVGDYVYTDKGVGEKILPYLRLSIGAESAILTVKQAQELWVSLDGFLGYPKWNGKASLRAEGLE